MDKRSSCSSSEGDHQGDWDFDDMFHHSYSSENQDENREYTDHSTSNEILPNLKKNFEDFFILGVIGEGAFGKVYQVKEKDSGKIFALKVLKKKHLLNKKAIESTIAERDILVKISHPFIVDLYYSFQRIDRVALVMDYVNGGQLFFHMRNEGIFNEDIAAFYSAQLVLALEHLHSMDILHRDLKPENILIDAKGNLVLTDFGLAKEYTDDDENRTHSFCGTIDYMSPEMISRKPYSKPSDFWAVGVLIFEMVVGKVPYRHKNQKKLEEMIKNGKKIVMPRYLAPATHSIIRGLTQKLPEKRLTVQQIKSHKFFQAIDWELLIEKEIPPPFRPTIRRGKLDTSNFDESVTSKTPTFSPASALTYSQDELFLGFSYCRSASPSYSFGSIEYENFQIDSHDMPSND